MWLTAAQYSRWLLYAGYHATGSTVFRTQNLLVFSHFLMLLGWMIGDPHFITLDGLKYTFNGHGEFYILQTINSSQFVVQGRMISVLGNDSNLARATVFSAIVAKQEDSDAVQFQLSRQGLDVLISGQQLQMNELTEQYLTNVIITKLPDSKYIALFSSDVSLMVEETNGIISLVNVVLPDRLRGQVEGLLGNYNGDIADDLRPKYESNPLPITTTSQNLHEHFGLTCKLLH